MAYIARPDIETAGVYAYLNQQEHTELNLWQRLHPSREHTDYPRARIWDDLQAGRPVNVPVWSLPKWARRNPEVRWWHRAIVRPDDTIAYMEDDTANVRLWLNEQEL
ncbi:hypothetical protein [Mycobacteroides abscessus]|uniref:hypothetical protein n=1 Tax=Mycobacteroides abscessus TaxID=36809 RepID=UPI00092851C4|nr:hypothetical protein [Mycobacteroides abscessus]SHY61488.1 Uncharacterised protein [Mycobacteroides abscessus subsp. bolletii]SHY72884.1 Uncharacterised protein [Mycobacteroides abscessus subsp. bolletii]